MPTPARDAVTVVLQYRDEILCTIRQPALKAFPGYHAFPGGKVDATEIPPKSSFFSEQDPRLMGALVREVQEETGFDLDAAAEAGELEAIHHLGCAVTPEFATLRFNTHFFNVELKRKPELHFDPGEISGGGFETVKELHRRWEAGEILAVPPTVLVIRLMAENPELQRIDQLNQHFDEAWRIPCVEPMRGLQILMVRSNTLPPASRTNCFVLGDDGHRRLMVDPSPRDDEEYERLRDSAGKLNPTCLFLTHHHPDHRQFADRLAREMNLPILLSADTQERIRKKSPEFLDGIETETIGDGDAVTVWRGHRVLAHAIPGHDAGQLGLAPENLAWFIVGDLIQGIGTVVIAPPEGDMATYFETLQRVIDLDPAVIFPSHGMGMGTTFRLKAALAHRIQREQQVLSAWKEDRSAEEMLDAIYPDLDPRLRPLALCNIQGHLGKLRDEGRIQ